MKEEQLLFNLNEQTKKDAKPVVEEPKKESPTPIYEAPDNPYLDSQPQGFLDKYKGSRKR